MKNSLHNISELINNHEIKKARSLISSLLRTEQQKAHLAQLLTYKAHVHLLDNKLNRAISDLLKVQDIDATLFDTPAVQSLLADCYLARANHSDSDISNAQLIYKSIIAEAPEYDDSGWIYYQYGQTLVITDQVELAITCFQTALNGLSNKTSLKAYCYERLGFIEFQNNRACKPALKLLNLAITTYPQTDSPIWLVSVHLLRSRIMLACGQMENAITAASVAVKIAALEDDNNTLTDALFAAGGLLAQIDGYEEKAITYLQLFLKNSPTPNKVSATWSQVYELMGDMYFKQSKYESAAAAYIEALEFNPDHPWEISICYRAAQCHYQQGDFKSAISTIERLLNAAQKDNTPINDYRVYDMLGNALFALTQYAEAKDAYQTALSLAPPSVQGLDKIKLYYHFSRQLLGNKQ